ncbi:MAG: hypothetical protein AAGD25_13240 [Cyanobacteria bacterium P01_F01_bin.150]
MNPPNEQFSNDLNQTGVDTIITRIDAYDQKWEKRMDRLFEGIDCLDVRVEEIATFMGQAAELQIQTQNKLDELASNIKQMNMSWDTRMNQLGDRIDRIAGSLEASQQTVAELTKLVTVLVNRVAA